MLYLRVRVVEFTKLKSAFFSAVLNSSVRSILTEISGSRLRINDTFSHSVWNLNIMKFEAKKT